MPGRKLRSDMSRGGHRAIKIPNRVTEILDDYEMPNAKSVAHLTCPVCGLRGALYENPYPERAGVPAVENMPHEVQGWIRYYGGFRREPGQKAKGAMKWVRVPGADEWLVKLLLSQIETVRLALLEQLGGEQLVETRKDIWSELNRIYADTEKAENDRETETES